MCQDVDVMPHIARWCWVLLLSFLILLRLLHLYLTLHVGLFDHFHLQEHGPSDSIHLIRWLIRWFRCLTHQLFRPHVVQYSLSVLAVMATLHDCKKKLGSIVLHNINTMDWDSFRLPDVQHYRLNTSSKLKMKANCKYSYSAICQAGNSIFSQHGSKNFFSDFLLWLDDLGKTLCLNLTVSQSATMIAIITYVALWFFYDVIGTVTLQLSDSFLPTWTSDAYVVKLSLSLKARSWAFYQTYSI